MFCDYQIFWHRHFQKPVFTEKDWQDYERAKENSIRAKAHAATARLVMNFRRKKGGK